MKANFNYLYEQNKDISTGAVDNAAEGMGDQRIEDANLANDK